MCGRVTIYARRSAGSVCFEGHPLLTQEDIRVRLDRIQRLAHLFHYQNAVTGSVGFSQIEEELKELFQHLPERFTGARFVLMDHAVQVIHNVPDEIPLRLQPLFARLLSVQDDTEIFATVDWSLAHAPVERPQLRAVITNTN